jgi:hypothetical protein
VTVVIFQLAPVRRRSTGQAAIRGPAGGLRVRI